ncbi:protein-disulfide reductase DsbD [Suttonella sp. R2A3]|uniref:protein-disulfide reductase DsbD n=1 Tax=Suttonella sp. R2A3 TaxID=2908648 RepID=UPI001F360F5A|nr:protein-disulfide reductase DsbD [Suttonella sp. R2A3]UJF24192.1 protein-disulfide reductase DsbD [Suttonella sp. R2A3]
MLSCLSLFTFAEPLPVKEAFQPSLTQTDDNRYALTIDFAAGYYIYEARTSLSIDGETISYNASPSTIKDDPYFGEMAVWHNPPILTFTSEQPVEEVSLRMQGCEDGVICYPPTQWTLTPEHSASSGISNLLDTNDPQNTASAAGSGEPLPEEQAFATTIDGNGNHISLSIVMPENYYLYKDSVRVYANGEELTSQISFPAGEAYEDPFRGAQTIYRDHLTLDLPQIAADQLDLVLNIQGCLEGSICYPPLTRSWQFDSETLEAFQGSVAADAPVPAPQADVDADNEASSSPSSTQSTTSRALSDTDYLSSILRENFWRTLPLILLLGIALSFTACIYPLIPIVTSLVVGKDSTKGRSYALISVYVLAMGLAMGALGAIFGLFEINLQVILQTPWITALVALFFAALALSLFDVYSFRAPNWLQRPIDKLNRRQQSGSFVGAAIMGALSVLVVSPCATPVLTALLLFTTQTTPLKGAIALFVFGVGTGLPLLLFAGVLRRFMPKAGTWMDIVKKGFAFALLAIAVWLVARILPNPWSLIIWALYALLFAVTVFPSERLTGFIARTRLFLAALGLIVALSLGISASNHWFTPKTSHSANIENNAYARFKLIDDEATLHAAIANSNQPVILDFYADWCVSCIEWERNIWQNPRFNAPLADYTLLKIDVTKFTNQHQAIFRRLNLVGPPAVLFYPATGELENPKRRIIGELSADEFAAVLEEESTQK